MGSLRTRPPMRSAIGLCSQPHPSACRIWAGPALAFWIWMLFPAWMAGQQKQPDPVTTSITVIENITAEAPANVSVLNQQQLGETPGINLDDRLRDIPGFSLFRRSSSLVAHPTTQGVSLRGVGSSGASRSLVLWDGIPVNDPFGGWVYWTRLSPYELNQVEISRGASTSLFGDRAMGGAITMFSREPERQRLQTSYEGGSQNSHEVSLGYSNLWNRWALAGFGRAFTTDGYFIVPEKIRGSVDRRAGVRFVTGDIRADYFGDVHKLFFKADILAEDRANGTALQNNSTGLGEAVLHYEAAHKQDSVSLLVFHTREDFRSSFSSISADRNTERLTYLQEVPSEATGAAGLWKRDASQWGVLAGADLYRVAGFSTDSLFPSGKRVGGGTMLQHGVFVQASRSLGAARFFAGARHSFTGQDRTFFSPSAGLVVGRGRWREIGRASCRERV